MTIISLQFVIYSTITTYNIFLPNQMPIHKITSKNFVDSKTFNLHCMCCIAKFTLLLLFYVCINSFLVQIFLLLFFVIVFLVVFVLVRVMSLQFFEVRDIWGTIFRSEGHLFQICIKCTEYRCCFDKSHIN